MTNSLFINFFEKYLTGIIGKITQLINDKAAAENLLHKTALTEEYSVDSQWGSTSVNSSVVAADIVSLDSPLPLKERAKIANVSGELPKVGSKMVKKESDIQKINTLIARGADEATLASVLFADDSNLLMGVDYRNEIAFQQALSTGYALVNGTNNPQGTAVRVDYGYLDANQLNATLKWDATSGTITPVSDIENLFDLADSKNVKVGCVWMSKKAADIMRASDEGKILVANYLGIVYTATNRLATPSRSKLIEALSDEFGAEFRIVETTIPVENADGTKTNIKPWEQLHIVATPTAKVGRLVYGTLAEETNPVQGVSYAKSGFKLVSKYGEVDPLRETTSVQALCLPVIDGASSIFVLHADTTAE